MARSSGKGRVTPKGGGGFVRKTDPVPQRAPLRDHRLTNDRQAFVSRAVARNTGHRGRR